VLLKECSLEVNTSVFQREHLFSPVNFTMDNFSENVGVSESKFVGTNSFYLYFACLYTFKIVSQMFGLHISIISFKH